MSMVQIEFVIPSVLNKGGGERKLPIEAESLSDAFQKVSETMGEEFKRRVFDLNGKPRSLINIYLNGKNIRFSSDGMATVLSKNDTIYILPAVAGGGEQGGDEQFSGRDMRAIFKADHARRNRFHRDGEIKEGYCVRSWSRGNRESCRNYAQCYGGR